jgi:hypothetical protein
LKIFHYCKDLTNIFIPHFENLPLLSQKAANLLLFKKIVEIINKKEHLTLEGLQKIINIRSSMNLGLSDLQKSEFPNYQSIERKLIQTTHISDPQWVAGFISGEGCFEVNIFKSNTHKIGSQVRLSFNTKEKNF